MCLECSWIDCKPVYICIYKYIPLYHVQFQFQCIKQCMNQFSNTQRSVTTAGYDELRWTSVSNKLSPRLQKSAVPSEAKCSLSAVAAVCWYLFEWFDGVVGRRGKRIVLYLANSYGLFPPYWQNDSKNFIKCLRPCDLYSTLSVTLFPPYLLSSILHVILLTVKVTVQILQVTVHDAHTMAQR